MWKYRLKQLWLLFPIGVWSVLYTIARLTYFIEFMFLCLVQKRLCNENCGVVLTWTNLFLGHKFLFVKPQSDVQKWCPQETVQSEVRKWRPKVIYKRDAQNWRQKVTHKSNVQKSCTKEMYKSDVQKWYTQVMSKIRFKSDFHMWRTKVTSKSEVQRWCEQVKAKNYTSKGLVVFF